MQKTLRKMVAERARKIDRGVEKQRKLMTKDDWAGLEELKIMYAQRMKDLKDVIPIKGKPYVSDDNQSVEEFIESGGDLSNWSVDSIAVAWDLSFCHAKAIKNYYYPRSKKKKVPKVWE